MFIFRVLVGCVIYKDKIYVIGKLLNFLKRVYLFYVYNRIIVGGFVVWGK